MSIGIRCLLTDDPEEAQALAARLDELNHERRSIEAKMQQEAQAAVRVLADPRPGTLERSGVVLFDAALAPGGRRPGRQPHQGAAAPSGHRLRARGRGDPARLGTLGARGAHP